MTPARERPTARRRGASIREAAVLAGGRSRRMGQEKALLRLEGRPLLERSLRLLGGRFERLLVSVPHEGPSEGIATVVADLRALGLRVDCVADRRPGALGPLAAVESVLGALEGPGVFVLAVDAPVLDFGLIDALCREVELPGRHAAIPSWRGGVEPLYAAYRRSFLPRVSELLDGGERRARALAEEAVTLLDVRHESPASPCGTPGELSRFASGLDPAEIFRNLNTPEEYRARLPGASGRAPDGPS